MYDASALLYEHYNSFIVLGATVFLGIATGLIGCFLILRRQALVSDAVAHATLPGLCIGFFLSLMMGVPDGRFLPVLLLCSGLTGYLGALAVHYITRRTRLSSDAAIACVMSFFYGLGLSLLGMIQIMSGGRKSGLDSFLLGQVSGVTQSDLIVLMCVSVIVLLVVLRYFKILRLFCFDVTYASLIGIKTKQVEHLLVFLMIVVVCVGLKTVGLILIVALLILPPLTARTWTEHCGVMLFLSALCSAMACIAGVYLSTLYDIPTGAMIVLCAFILFALSLCVRFMRRVTYG